MTAQSHDSAPVTNSQFTRRYKQMLNNLTHVTHRLKRSIVRFLFSSSILIQSVRQSVIHHHHHHYRYDSHHSQAHQTPPNTPLLDQEYHGIPHPRSSDSICQFAFSSAITRNPSLVTRSEDTTPTWLPLLEPVASPFPPHEKSPLDYKVQ